MPGREVPTKIWQSKSVGILTTQVRWKDPGNPDEPLKGPHTDSLALTLGFGRRSAAQEVQETNKEILSCVALEWGLEGQPPLSLHRALLPCSLQFGTILTLLKSLTDGQFWNWIIGLVRLARSIVTPWAPALHNLKISLGKLTAWQPAPHCTLHRGPFESNQ